MIIYFPFEYLGNRAKIDERIASIPNILLGNLQQLPRNVGANKWLLEVSQNFQDVALGRCLHNRAQPLNI